jgi:phenylalanine-4-hydroxylase
MKDYVVELESDHPGFNDPEYRLRRDEIASLAPDISAGGEPEIVSYTDRERETWGTVFDQLTSLYPTHACEAFNRVIGDLGYGAGEIPQLRDVSRALTERTGFSLQPVAGLVSAREFLGKLADRVFCSTQYIRHHSEPFYTPEPDIVHELMGHAPMLAIPDFANLSQKIGEGAATATDDEVEQLATLYWFTIEYGLLKTSGGLRAYGAGLLSSYGELEHALSGAVEVRRFDPLRAKDTAYPITTYQPLLWWVESIGEAFEKIDEYVATL